MSELRAFPREIFAQEGTYVLFTTTATDPQAQLALIQVDENGVPLTYVGVMTDDRTLGDRIAGDRIFSRKFEINGSKETLLHFTVIIDDGNLQKSTFRNLPLLSSQKFPQVAVSVVFRPNLIQILTQVWDRWTAPQHFQPDESVHL